jgi:CRISPR-associated endonuclease/helicase Cas3
MFKEPLAHITVDGREHTLRKHLFKIAERAAVFAAAFGFRGWGWLGGLWHDLGKYSQAFRKKLEAAAGDEADVEVEAYEFRLGGGRV